MPGSLLHRYKVTGNHWGEGEQAPYCGVYCSWRVYSVRVHVHARGRVRTRAYVVRARKSATPVLSCATTKSAKHFGRAGAIPLVVVNEPTFSLSLCLSLSSSSIRCH